MSHLIHKSAIIENGAQIADSVKIGAFCHIGADVVLADDIILESHVVIGGHTNIGESTHIYPFASIGLPPQDLKFSGEKTTLEIGKNNVIREHVTMNPGTKGGGSITKIGNNCLFMVATHIAHDCQIGDNVILANNATIAGHVEIDDFAIVGGMSAVHQFVKIGKYAMIGGMSAIENDVIPYATAMGERANLAGLNIRGLKRSGKTLEDIKNLRAAYEILFTSVDNMEENISNIKKEFNDNPLIDDLIDFTTSQRKRALCQPK